MPRSVAQAAVAIGALLAAGAAALATIGAAPTRARRAQAPTHPVRRLPSYGISGQWPRSTGSAAAPTRGEPVTVSVRLPSSWTRLRATDPQVAELATNRTRTLVMLVRVTPLALPVRRVTVRDLPALRPLADRLVGADPRVHLIEPPAEVDIHGTAGYAYVYIDRRRAGGGGVAHVHYLLFARDRLIALVFQVAQPSRLTRVAPALARVAATLRVRA